MSLNTVLVQKCMLLLIITNAVCGARESRWLSLFNVVTFAHESCPASAGLTGTCLTAGECSGRAGGVASGNCALGFGVCCLSVLDTCGSTVAANCTYVTNPNFPSAFTQAGVCGFTINQVADDICSIRLDMETFTINGPDLTNIMGTCRDTFIATDAIGNAAPTICGENAGQHMYLNAGRTSSQPLTINFNFNGNANRRFRIKISQIQCGTLSTPEPGCLMYLTGVSGQVRGYNFDAPPTEFYHLSNQNYEICLRQEEGYCRVAWIPTPDVFSFKLTGKLNPVNGDKSRTGDQGCKADFLLIPNGMNGRDTQCLSSKTVPSPTIDRYCGGKLNCINNVGTNSQILSDKFTIGVMLNGRDQFLPNNNRGFEFDWRQIPC